MKKRSAGLVAATIAVVQLSASSAALAAASMIEGLPRRADLGFFAVTTPEGLKVLRLVQDSQAAKAGLVEGATITQINGQTFARPYIGESMAKRLDGGVPVTLTVADSGASKEIRFTPRPLALEKMPGVVSTYGSVKTPDGATLRTIITRPEGITDRLNPIFLTQWVSCGSIEYRANGGEAREILARIAQESKLALVRVERSTDGDSEGPACHELDYDTEVAHYAHAFTEILKSPLLDRNKVYVYGSSLGSTTAPLVAAELQKRGVDIAGVAIQGGGGLTYYERMLNFDRIYLERRPGAVKPAAIHDEMINRARFHYHYLINGTDPDEVAKGGPGSAAVRRDVRGLGDGEHYGRPYAWHQQATKRNFLGAWSEVDAPVLVIFNEFDQFELRYGHALIVDTVNRLRPGSGTLVEQKGIDHNNTRFDTIEAAYADESGTPVPELTSGAILDWLKKIDAGK